LAGNFKKIGQKRGRPSEWETAPNSVTWGEGNKGLRSLLSQGQ
jgi:hypothetical protein